ncbi:hypothetical protein WJX72_007807 [[Myrmecia] bisecta]|uniref:Cyclic nucleotide-binding domain-containing protein n=1 Tax=[Myrmecia] bisecta TaxID=41462 RepID=A0AAW1PH53_9CHLO
MPFMRRDRSGPVDASSAYGPGRYQSASSIVGPAVDVEPYLPLVSEAEEEALSHLFVPRRAVLTQEQWDTYRSSESLGFKKSGSMAEIGQIKLQYDSAVDRSGGWSSNLSRRFAGSTHNLEAQAAKDAQLRRQATSIFWLPLINPRKRSYVLWTNIILLIDLTYTAFLVPILVGFEVSAVNFGWGCYIDLIAGCFYAVELGLGFHVGFVGRYNMQRKVIMDGRGIAWYYLLKGSFAIDLLTTLAWLTQITLIILTHVHDDTNLSAITAYQIIRILRLARFMSLLRRLYATAVAATSFIFPGITFSHASIYTFNLLYGGGVLGNFLACLWNWVAKEEGLEDTWVNYYAPFVRHYGDGASQLTQAQAASIPGPLRYLTGLYYVIVTIATVGYGDIVPATPAETAISICCMLVGLVFFGLLLGAIADAMQRVSKDAHQAALFRGRMDAVDKWMRKRHLPRKLRQRIGAYYAEEWLSHNEASEEVGIMDELPHKLRKDISYQLNRPLFLQLRIFFDFPEHIQAAIAAMMTPMQVPPGFELCQEDDDADSFWLLHEGEVAAVNVYQRLEEVTTLKAPSLVGQEALLQEQDEQYMMRHSTFRAHTSCLLWELRLRELLPLLNRHPDLYARASTQAVPSHQFDYLAINPPYQAQTREERQAALDAAADAATAALDEASSHGAPPPRPSGPNASPSISERPDLRQKSSPGVLQNGAAQGGAPNLGRSSMSRTMQLKMQRLSTGKKSGLASSKSSKFGLIREGTDSRLGNKSRRSGGT